MPIVVIVLNTEKDLTPIDGIGTKATKKSRPISKRNGDKDSH
jgi:hypothetical protein